MASAIYRPIAPEVERGRFAHPVCGILALLVLMSCANALITHEFVSRRRFEGWAAGSKLTADAMKSAAFEYRCDVLAAQVPLAAVVLPFVATVVVAWMGGGRRWAIAGLVPLALTAGVISVAVLFEACKSSPPLFLIAFLPMAFGGAFASAAMGRPGAVEGVRTLLILLSLAAFLCLGSLEAPGTNGDSVLRRGGQPVRPAPPAPDFLFPVVLAGVLARSLLPLAQVATLAPVARRAIPSERIGK